MIEGCLAQDFRDFELVIVDDGSRDDSVAVAARYADSRIQILRHNRNRGPCPARYTAVVKGARHVGCARPTACSGRARCSS